MANKFKYRPTSGKSLKERAERSGGGFETYIKSGLDIYKNKVGENCVRICPPTFKNAKHFGLDVWVHGFVGPDKASFLCLKKQLGKKCPICIAAAEALDAGEKKESDQMKAKQKTLYWVIDRDGDSGEPEVWPVSWSMDKDISGCCSKRNGRILEIDNPDNGHDVTFRRTGQSLNTRYSSVAVESDTTPLVESKKKMARILDFIEQNPLDEILKYHTPAQMEESLAGGAGEKDEHLDDDEDEDDNKKRRRHGRDDDDEEDDGRKSRARRGRSSDDEDEEEEPNRKRRTRSSSSDDGEDDEAPRGRRRSRDDDDDDDGGKKKRRSRSDDDEEERPGRGRRSRNEDERDPADDDEEEDGDDDRRSSKLKKKKKSRDEDGDEDEDPHDGNKRKKKSSRDDDEDDEDDEDEDDEDDAPKKSKKKSSRDDDEDEDDEDDIPSSRRAKRNR